MTPVHSAVGARPIVKPRASRALAVIAVYKFVKMTACIALAAAAFNLLRPDFAGRFERWLESLAWVTRHGIVTHAIDSLLDLEPRQFRMFGIAALIYALLYAVQGLGLWFGKRWAEYLVIIETGLLLPIEVWELAHRYSIFKLIVLFANIAIMIYLIGLLRRRDPDPSRNLT